MNLSIFTKIELIKQINDLNDKSKKFQSEVEYMRERTGEFQQKIAEHKETEEGFKTIILEQAEEIDRFHERSEHFDKTIDEKQVKISEANQSILSLSEKLDDIVEECASKYVNLEQELTNKLAKIEVKLENAEADNNYFEEKLYAIEQKHLQVTVYDHAL